MIGIYLILLSLCPETQGHLFSVSESKEDYFSSMPFIFANFLCCLNLMLPNTPPRLIPSYQNHLFISEDPTSTPV